MWEERRGQNLSFLQKSILTQRGFHRIVIVFESAHFPGQKRL